MSDQAPKARPIYATVACFMHFAGSALFIAGGLAGVEMRIPAVGVAMIGAVWLFPSFMAGWLAWQHWRLRAALRDIDRARAGQ